MLEEVQPGCKVTLHLSMSLSDGTEMISTFDDEPVTCTLGDDTLRPGMEFAIYGLKAGDEESVTLTPEQSYGEHDPGKIFDVPVSDFPADMQPEIGLVMGFTTPSGEETPGLIREIGQEQVKVDFNHPMAGHEILFKVKILEIHPGDIPV